MKDVAGVLQNRSTTQMIMKFHPIPLFLSLFALALPAMADSPVEVVGVQIIRKAYGTDGGNKLVPFNSFKPGVEIALGVNLKDGGLISIDEDASVLTKFTDDQGTDLITKEFGRKGFGSFPKQSEDGKYGLLSVETSKLPAATATKVMAAGKIALTTASLKKPERTKAMELKKGATFALGKMNFKINQAKSGSGELELQLETTDDIKALAEVRFIGPGNTKLESDRNGSGSMSFGGKRTNTLNYTIKGAAASVIIEGDVWQDAKQVDLPFDLTVTLPVATGK